MDPKQLFEAGELSKAIEAMTALVKAQPADAARRTFLFELLSFAGEWDRARKQLDVISHQSSQAEWAVSVYNHLIDAEQARRKFFEQGKPPEFLLDIPDHIQRHLEAAAHLAAGRASEASAALAAAAETTPAVSGTVNGRPFAEMRDCDDLLAPVLELIIVHDYVWVPLSQLRSLEIAPPERPRDLLWTPVRIALADGVQRSGYLPSTYFASAQQADEALKLGHATDWRVVDGAPVQGLGQHQFLFDETELGLLEIRKLEISAS